MVQLKLRELVEAQLELQGFNSYMVQLKHVLQNGQKELMYQFQFLHGPIKALWHIIKTRRRISFNSYMVQLKLITAS